MQTGCVVKGEAQKSPLVWQFSGDLDFLTCVYLLGIPVSVWRGGGERKGGEWVDALIWVGDGASIFFPGGSA